MNNLKNYYTKEQNEFLEKLIKKIQLENAQAYLVGGFIRDILIQQKNTDIDIEIYNISYKKLLTIITELTTIKIKTYPEYGIISIYPLQIEIGLPRREKNLGYGYNELIVEINPKLPMKEAILRRDLTINTLMYDLVQNKLIDQINARQDLINKEIKMINSDFQYDALRYLRALRFSLEKDFRIENQTMMVILKNIETLGLIKNTKKQEELKKIYNVDSNNFQNQREYFEQFFLNYFNKYYFFELEKKLQKKDVVQITTNLLKTLQLIEKNNLKITEKQKYIMFNLILFEFLETKDFSEKISTKKKRFIISDLNDNKKDINLILKILVKMKQVNLLERNYHDKLINFELIYDLVHEYKDNLIIILLYLDLKGFPYLTILKVAEQINELKIKYNGHYFLTRNITGSKITQKQKEKIITDLTKE